jgi:hypothetical protein
MPGADELFQMQLNLHPNEASGLLMIGDKELLGEHGWDLGFWACLDEGEIEDCIAAIGHRRGSPHEEGVRDLALLETGEGEELHLVTGNVDSRDKQSVLIQDYPGGRETVATHFRCVLPKDAHSSSLRAEFVREFPSLPRVEGMAVTPEGRTYYVTDEDEGVHLRLTRLLVG